MENKSMIFLATNFFFISGNRLKPVFWKKCTLKSRIKFNFFATENSTNQSYCSLCVPRDQNNSRSPTVYGIGLNKIFINSNLFPYNRYLWGKYKSLYNHNLLKKTRKALKLTILTIWLTFFS